MTDNITMIIDDDLDDDEAQEEINLDEWTEDEIEEAFADMINDRAAHFLWACEYCPVCDDENRPETIEIYLEKTEDLVAMVYVLECSYCGSEYEHKAGIPAHRWNATMEQRANQIIASYNAEHGGE